MIIGVDARPLGYRLTGIGYYLKNALQKLQEVDHHNTYLLVSNRPIHFDCFRPGWRKLEGRMGARFLSTLWMQAIAPVLAARVPMDLFWATRHHLPLLLPAGMKKVVTVHDLVHKRFPATMARENLLVERLLMGPSLNRADAVVAVSRATAREIEHFYRIPASKIHVVYPGVPAFENDSDPKEDLSCSRALPEKYFLFVGTLEPRKNLLTVVKAFKMVVDSGREVHLVIVGSRGWRQGKNLPDLIKELPDPVRGRIIVPGYVDRAVLKKLYGGALALVFPSIYEGLGMPLLEAMAAGVPIITSNVSSMAEVARDCALLVDPGRAADAAGAMEEILRRPDVREDLVARGKKRADDFSWDTFAGKMIKIFQQVGAS